MKSRGFLGIVFAFLAFSLLLTSCSKGKSEQDIESKGLPSSGGKTLEAILVIPDEVYKGEIKDSIGEYFMKACPWLPQPEPLFDVVQMNPVGFYNSEMFTKHRNIIIVDIKAGNPNKLKKQIDYKSYPQAYFEFSVDNRDSLFALMNRYSDLIKEQFYNNEHRRVNSAFKKLEKKLLPHNFDYKDVSGLRIEAQQKLNKYQPLNIGQASRISGVSPADISVLMVHLEQVGRK